MQMQRAAPPSEATSLLPPPQGPVVDEENGISVKGKGSCASDANAKAKKGKPSNSSWTEAFARVSPFIRPEDRKHAALAFLALFTVMLEKLINVLPPLAIKHAVDAISGYSGVADANDPHATVQQQVASTVTWSIVAYFLLKTLDAGVSSLQNVCQQSVSLDAERRFATKLFAHLQVLGAAYHLERHAGELIQVLSRGSGATGTIISTLWFSIIPTLFEAVVVGTVFWKVLGTPSIAITTVTSVALYLVYTVKMTNTRLEQRRKVIESSETVGRIETESLVNYETIVMFGKEGGEVERYGTVRKEYKNERVDMLGLFACIQLGQQSIRLAGTCIGLWLAGRAAVYGAGGGGGDFLSAGSFVVVQLYIQQLFTPLSILGFMYRQLSEALTDLEKAIDVLKSKPIVMDAKDALDWDTALKQKQRESSDKVAANNTNIGWFSAKRDENNPLRGGITFDNVTFKYQVVAPSKKLGGPDKRKEYVGKGFRGRGRAMWSGSGAGMGANFWIKSAKSSKESDGMNRKEDKKLDVGGIENVSFHIPAGKTAALVGPSGSGKTTIVRLLLRLYDPKEGAVMVDNINVKDLMQTSLRSNIGVVAQETILFHASLRDNIIYGKENATEEEVLEAVRISSLSKFVEALPSGLDTLVGERGMKLSGGERQRVGLARCIIKQPKLVLLDEATSALDSGTEREIQRNILNSETAAAICKGRTTLMIAHRLSTARKADMILVLDKGKLVEKGTHEELLARRGQYAHMWSNQMLGDTSDME